MTGEELRKYRLKAHYTQERLGIELGYSLASAERTVQLWEHDDRPIPMKQIRKLAKLLDLPLEKFIP